MSNLLRWAIAFLIIALIAGLLGVTGVAGVSERIAYVLFVVFLVVFACLLVFNLLGGKNNPPPL